MSGNKYQVHILDPDTRVRIHTITHPIWASSFKWAVEIARREYGFPVNGWILKAVVYNG